MGKSVNKCLQARKNVMRSDDFKMQRYHFVCLYFNLKPYFFLCKGVLVALTASKKRIKICAKC